MSSDYQSDYSSFGSESNPQRGGHLRLDLRRLITLRSPLMMGVFLALAIPCSIAAWVLSPEEFRASAQLRFLASAPRVLQEGGGSSLASYEKFVNTQVALITGPAILSRVFEDPEIRSIAEIADQTDPVSFMESRIMASAQRNSELVELSIRLSDGAVAAKVLEKILDQYMEYALGEEASSDSERLRILMKERDTRRFELDSQLTSIVQLQRDIGIPLAEIPRLGPSETEAYRTNFAKAMEDLSLAKALFEQHEQHLEDVRELRKRFEENRGHQIFELDVERRVSSDPRVSMLRIKLSAGDAQVAVLAHRLREDSPQLLVDREANESLAQELRSVEKSVRRETLDSLLANVLHDLGRSKRSVKEAEARKLGFQDLLDKLEARAAFAASALAELENLKMRAGETRSQLRNVRQTIAAISIENQAPARVKRLTDPTVPKYPDRSRAFQLVVLAIVGSMAAGVFVGLWREVTDQEARTSEDLSWVTSLPILAAVPQLNDDDFDGPVRPSLLCAEYPDSRGADEYRRILAKVVYPSDGSVETTSCLITSATTGDGKTSLSCNLAISLAQSNREVLLVDLCPMDSGVERQFGLDPAEGLADILTGSASLAGCARETFIQNLKVIGPGTTSIPLAEKLASRQMMEFMEQTEEAFDHVIVDSPPALLIANAKLVAPMMDSVFVVVGAGNSTLGMLKRLLLELEQVDANVVGLIMNGVRPTRGGYFQENQHLFHNYGKSSANGNADRDIPDMEVSDDEPEDLHEAAMLLTSDEAGRDDARG